MFLERDEMDACRSEFGNRNPNNPHSSTLLAGNLKLCAGERNYPTLPFIPNKPNKYGIKIVTACDTKIKYVVDMSPYLGKCTKTDGMPLEEFYIKEMTKTLRGSNRNIMVDNWFTTVKLADDLLRKNLTLVGDIRTNKWEIPPELLSTKKRKVGTSMFCFFHKKTLVSYKAKAKKMVVLLSTAHDHWKTRRWPICMFYGMVNIGFVNSSVIHSHNNQHQGTNKFARKDFLVRLSEELTMLWMAKRLEMPSLQRHLQMPRASIGTNANKKRKSWEKAAMTEAVIAVWAKKMGLKRAAKDFQVPKTTLRRLALDTVHSPENVVEQ
ncbi:hypothetical protein ANN_17273 [Periplaneta americana]|uniref:PiggyBac transposable element-derived protein domain-containing protein n=1 Tax=Periplaneta americana TaxID=6978 RepID=A0ABQ8ST27_PERAM|nr:hypothetical protein ANN_17273 [Periplaneta americana]